MSQVFVGLNLTGLRSVGFAKEDGLFVFLFRFIDGYVHKIFVDTLRDLHGIVNLIQLNKPEGFWIDTNAVLRDIKSEYPELFEEEKPEAQTESILCSLKPVEKPLFYYLNEAGFSLHDPSNTYVKDNVYIKFLDDDMVSIETQVTPTSVLTPIFYSRILPSQHKFFIDLLSILNA